MQEIDIATIKHRSIKGVFSLVSRTFLIQLIGQVVTFLLTVYLSPSDYGLFFLVSTVITFLAYFSDIGLAAALIQKKEEITPEDLRTTFTIQQILVVLLVIIGFAITPFVAKTYALDSRGVILYEALILAFFLSSLKTIPSILLERTLQFNKLVIPDIVETLGFNLVVLVLAIKGFGVTSFTYGVMTRGLAGLITIYIISPWRPTLGISKTVAKRLLSFGIPFQANSLLALAKDNLFFLYLGAILPKPALGFIGVAQKWAYLPLRLIMDNIIRITFPSFSRLASHADYLGKAIEKTLFSTAFIIFPSLVGMVMLMPHFISIFPKYQKWEPALFSLTFFAMNAILSSISTPLTNALNAIGKIKISLYLMIFWTAATWIITPILIHFYGFNGVSIGSGVISLSVVGVVMIVKRYISFSIFSVTFYPAVATIVMAVTLYFMSTLIHNFPMFFLSIFVGGVVYLLTMYLLARDLIRSDVQLIVENLRK
ncbi:MAG TPA: oligosaccharide flippase family protein [Patescibacteria group bacterium]|nr:oligosaccharide flippase family protein [Patescibacteria group bacterium]